MTDSQQTQPRVVVVDDDRLIRELVADTILGRGAIETCESAANAQLEKAMGNHQTLLPEGQARPASWTTADSQDPPTGY